QINYKFNSGDVSLDQLNKKKIFIEEAVKAIKDPNYVTSTAAPPKPANTDPLAGGLGGLMNNPMVQNMIRNNPALAQMASNPALVSNMLSNLNASGGLGALGNLMGGLG